ncbi:MAG: tRNA uridine-5-carboxymethylaminomethyl(34) synthesis GTPase MnmE [Marinibacterium sp.]
MAGETIFAEASAPGKAGISVIRISGAGAFDCVRTLAGDGLDPRGMALRTLRDRAGEVLDTALVLTFSGPASFTGEDVVELHLHGSRAVVSAVLADLANSQGARLAEPGEFTRRALENGKLDLAQVEGLSDLIEAETEAQRHQAQRVLAGALGDVVDRWRQDLIRAAALLEAVIDFADEEVPEDVSGEVGDLLTGVLADLARERSGVGMAERVRDGFEVAIVGVPNVGKSTLINKLAGRPAALTSDIAGTTRDVIEVRMDLNGLAVTVLDTAGVRPAGDVVEGLGVDLALRRAETADLRVFLMEDAPPPGIEVQPEDIIVRAKADLRDPFEGGVSGLTGQGVDQLIAQVSDVLSRRAGKAGTATRARHLSAMEAASDLLTSAQAVLSRGPEQYDIAAEDIRQAIRRLESLVGRIDVETLLDDIFANFCLGK